MKSYQLKVTTKAGVKVHKLSTANRLTIDTDKNTKYEILDENGNLVNFNAQEWEGNDLAVSLESSTAPNVILKDYFDNYPIEDKAYLAEIAASLATGSEEYPFILATEVTGSTLSSSTLLYGAAGLATIGGLAALIGSGGSSGNSTQNDKSKPTTKETEPVEESKPA
ncbi:TPA: hypothetical protein ACK3JW_002252, partial [Mannheimia haemolytica]